MSDIKIKARVVLTDDEGRHLGECEIITDSEEIFYNNATPMPNAVGELPAGTTFDRYSVSRIIDALLYKKGSPSFGEIIFSNADSFGDKYTITKPVGEIVDPFTLTATIYFGSYDILNIHLNISTDGTTIVKQQELVRTDKNIICQTITFEVDSFNKDTNIWFEIQHTDGNEKSNMISYKFVSPVYIGWVRPDIINDKGELDKEIAEDYLQELIYHRPSTIYKSFQNKSNQYGYITPFVNYSTRQQLNPFILIPQTWGELKRITDMNGHNITNSYAKYVGLDINTHGEYIEHYIGYVCRQTFDNDCQLIKGITYVTDESVTDVNLDNFLGNATPTTVGFSVQYGIPLDERNYRKTYGDLLAMKYPYPGLQTYVEDINTTFRFERGHWSPISTKTHIIESMSELTEDLGGWDDIAINAYDGKLWKKRYNNQWERYGDIKSEDGIWIGKENIGDGK